MSNNHAVIKPELNQELAEGFIMSLIAVNTAASLMNIGINSTLIDIILKLKLQRRISHRFILCLSFSDLCVGTIVQPILSIRLSISDPTVLPVLRLALVFLGIFFVQTSGIMTAVVSLDRYLHMRHLTYYNSRMTKKRANLLMAASVIISFLISLFVSVGAVLKLTVYVTTVWLSLNIVILCVIVVFYIRAYLSIRVRVADMAFQSGNNHHSHRIQRPDIEFMKGMMFILIALLVFYVPYEIIGILVFFMPSGSSDKTHVNLQYAYYCCLIFVYLISSYNGIILIMFDRKLRGYFQRNILRRGQSNSSISAMRDTTVCLEDIP